jgi:hypothetical protein
MKKKINSIVEIIWGNRKSSIKLEKLFLNKKTARARAKALLKDSNGVLYCLELARNPVEDFYLKRTVEIPLKLQGRSFIQASHFGSFHDQTYALFPIIPNAKHFKEEIPCEILKEIQGDILYTKTDKDQVFKIISGFLSAWPSEIHTFIQKLNIFEYYVETLQKFEQVYICNEHGDLSPNNILDNRNLKVIDFEFYKPYQIAGFDLFYNRKVRNLPSKDTVNFHNEHHKLKLMLIHAINRSFDLNLTNVIFYTSNNSIDVLIDNIHLGKKDLFLASPKTNEQIKLFLEKIIKDDLRIELLKVCPENIKSIKNYTSNMHVIMTKVLMWGYLKTIKKLFLGKIIFFKISSNKNLILQSLTTKCLRKF